VPTPAPAPLAVASLQPPASTVVLGPTAAQPATAPVTTLIPMQSLGSVSTQPRFTLDTLRHLLGGQAMWVDLTGPAVTPAEVLDIDRSQDRFFTSNSVAAKVRTLADRAAAEPLQCTP
jgi:hypothetical protein